MRVHALAYSMLNLSDVDDEMVRAIGPLVFGRDVVAVQYVDGKRHNIGGDVSTVFGRG